MSGEQKVSLGGAIAGGPHDGRVLIVFEGGPYDAQFQAYFPEEVLRRPVLQFRSGGGYEVYELDAAAGVYRYRGAREQPGELKHEDVDDDFDLDASMRPIGQRPGTLSDRQACEALLRSKIEVLPTDGFIVVTTPEPASPESENEIVEIICGGLEAVTGGRRFLVMPSGYTVGDGDKIAGALVKRVEQLERALRWVDDQFGEVPTFDDILRLSAEQRTAGED